MWMPTKDADLNKNNTTIVLFKTLNKMQITPLKLQVILTLSPKVSRFWSAPLMSYIV